MMKRRRIAVISDLHIGYSARCLDFCPYEDVTASDKIAKDQRFFAAFQSLCASRSFIEAGTIDALCITGDVSDRAHPAEFMRANEVISKIVSFLNIEKSRVFYVPGNHDVSWAIKPWLSWEDHRYDPLFAPTSFTQWLPAASFGGYEQPPFFSAWESDDLLVVGVNSAAYDVPKPGDGIHYGLVKEETVREIDAYCERLNRSEHQVRVCLLHHHPILYSDPRPDVADVSAAVNAENLRKILSKHRFDLVVHGHKHWPRIGTHLIANQWPLSILGAGSFSALPDPQWTGETANQFHVIEVSGRDDENGHSPGLAYGHVETWAYQINGVWAPGNARVGLRASEGYGSVVSPAVVERMVQKALAEAQGEGVPCDWDRLVATFPNLRHINAQVLHSAMAAEAVNRGLKFRGDVDSDRTHWILY